MSYLKKVEKVIEKEFEGDEILGEVIKATTLYAQGDARRQQILDDIKESENIFQAEFLSKMRYTYDASGNTVPIKGNPNIPLWLQCITNNDATNGDETIQLDNGLNIGNSDERQLQITDKLHDTKPVFQ
jgi:hypothetical protein